VSSDLVDIFLLGLVSMFNPSLLAAVTVMLLLRGLTSKEIADEMRISPSTVKSFLKLVMTKVGATSRTGIIAKILEEGIVILFLNLN